MAIEQLVCVYADAFIGSRRSSVSQHVLSLRAFGSQPETAATWGRRLKPLLLSTLFEFS
jgi:hypothetical protein